MTSTEHFSERELACHHCGMVAAQPHLLLALEHTRHALGDHPIALRSAVRCVVHNATVGGAPRSQHLFGLAVDLVNGIPVEQVRALGMWSGIGRKGDLAVHLDLRHVRPATNFNNGQPSKPTIWTY